MQSGILVVTLGLVVVVLVRVVLVARDVREIKELLSRRGAGSDG